MRSDDELAKARARKKCNANRSLFPTYASRVDTRVKPPKLAKLSPDGTLPKATSSANSPVHDWEESGPRLSLNPAKMSMVKSIIHSRVERSKQFCSWECVKAESVGQVPVHYRYEKEMLVNVAAGYEVPYPAGY